MRKNSLATIIIAVIMFLVTVRFIHYFPIAPVILFIVVFRLVRRIRNQRYENDRTGRDTAREEKTYHTAWEEKTSEKENRDSFRAESENTIITCEYCGSKVDTGKHAVCDHCGGPYWDNEEWKEIRRRRNRTDR